jgi:hypothetical protein
VGLCAREYRDAKYYDLIILRIALEVKFLWDGTYLVTAAIDRNQTHSCAPLAASRLECIRYYSDDFNLAGFYDSVLESPEMCVIIKCRGE